MSDRTPGRRPVRLRASAPPATIGPALLRHVFSHLPTGVTVVTAAGAHGPEGMSANSVTSVSLDPPLLLFCPAESSTTWPEIRATGRFCVNIFASHHAEMSQRFSRRDIDRFMGVAWHRRAAGPAIDDALGWIDCTIDDVRPAGDHLIVVAEVQAVSVNDMNPDPLVFFRGRYGSFAP